MPNASGVLANSTMRTVGQVDVKIKMSNINFLFEGHALILENLSLTVILGVNFLKFNSLSPILEPDMAQLVHTPSQQAQMLIANVSSGNFQKNISPSRSRPKTRRKRSNRSEISPQRKFRSPPPLLILKGLLMELLSSWFGLLNMSLFRLKQHEE